MLQNLISIAFLRFVFLTIWSRLTKPILAEDPWYGALIGDLSEVDKLPDGQMITGQVYAVNESCLQILDFQFDEMLCDRAYFWISYDLVLSLKGQKVPSFEYKDDHIKSYFNARVIVNFPSGRTLRDVQSFGVWCAAKEARLAHVAIPSTLSVPKAQILGDTLKIVGQNRYGLKTGHLEILDLRTLKIHDFFIKFRAPEFFFIAGKGQLKNRQTSQKVGIRGFDDYPNHQIKPFKFKYNKPVDIILDLPERHDVNNIEWVGIWVDTFLVNLGYISVTNLSDTIPPYLAAPYNTLEPQASRSWKPWPQPVLLFNGENTDLDFKLGPPGGKSGFSSWWYPKVPNELVFYVNGILAPELQLQADVNYTIKIQAGSDPKGIFHPLWITDDFDTLPEESVLQKSLDDRHTTYFGPSKMNETANYVGKLCLYSAKKSLVAENFSNFYTYSKYLQLKCADGPATYLKWNPSKESIGKKLYYQSYTTSNMGGRIKILEKVVIQPANTQLSVKRDNKPSKTNDGCSRNVLFSLLFASLGIFVNLFYFHGIS